MVLVVMALVSCRSSREMIFLNDMYNGEVLDLISGNITEHLIKPGDILYVTIKSINPELNAIFNPGEGATGTGYTEYQKFTTPSGAYLYGFEVTSEGNLVLPSLGKIPVAGLTQSKIEEQVQKRADLLLKEALVKVKLLNYKVTVLGEVRSPGIYYNYNNTFTVLDALAMANGNTDYATIKNVKVIRPGADGNTAYLLDLSSKDIYFSEGFYLEPNDYIFVHPDKYKTLQLNSQAYSLLMSSVSVLIAVLAFVLK